MSFLTEWITNIIVFILLAVIIDLLLPNSSMQKYAKMVISLLLIVVIINPIFKIFSKDMNEVLREFSLESSSNDDRVKNLIEFQKKEIQASQRAYILEQMAVQMKTMADEELVEKYDVGIERILLSDSNDLESIESYKDLQHIQVMIAQRQLVQSDQNPSVEVIQPVSIDTSESLPVNEAKEQVNEVEVIADLAEIWGVGEEVITLQVERGEESLDE
ncbi:stage III sporulation protein AF [Bacillus weihaiensis]|uniref:Stage III sporulation protein AF n=1 Tax=Bacillus weihaiensis TaxID=1547283 RepID=A0A1L3MQ29_9BACI|nr:stage III sporulation protein AF [Bacillus weihaiensis]APH04449.1 stage III sporulation protein AF [Bacillus weihaiensis]